jgi:hypothetical protein
MSKIEVDAIEPQSGTTLTIGASGDTITIPAGATLTGSGASLAWQSVQTTGFTASAGNAYPCNTTSAGFTVTLPATPSAGDQVQLVDYAGTFDTNFLTIDPNGEDIQGGTDNLVLNGEREGVILTYIDSTQGWIATSGINEGTDALSPLPYSIDFLVIAGGGGGRTSAQFAGGGGGAGGYRTSTQTASVGTVITVTVGDGGALGASGSNSSISGSGLSTITSAGGALGGPHNGGTATAGGSGGGGGSQGGIAGAGNTPSTSPSQGNNGGAGSAPSPSGSSGGGGGGAGAVGNAATAFNIAGAGGAGTASSITGSSVTRAGGGGGAYDSGTGGLGGTGGGGQGRTVTSGTLNGTANTGGGAGAGTTSAAGGTGGKGVVILAFPLANFSGTVTGSPTESDDGTTKVLVFNGSGSYTA